MLTIRHSLNERSGPAAVKDTRTHQMRRISLDVPTVELLAEHKKCTARNCDAIDAPFDDDAFVFSYAPDHQRPCSPSGVTHRYERMVRKLGIRTRLHSMRHYSATELLSTRTARRPPIARSNRFTTSAAHRGLSPRVHRLGGPRSRSRHL